MTNGRIDRGLAVMVLLAACGAACAPEAGDVFDEARAPIIGAADMSNADAARSGVVLVDVRAEGITCTGTLIDRQWVVTAAHCFGSSVNDMPDADGDGRLEHPSDVGVNFGNFGDASRVRIAADLVTRHPNAIWGSPDGVDVALVHLSSPAPAFTPLVTNHFTNGRMEIYGGKNATLVGKAVTLMGYGKNVPGYGAPFTGAGTLRQSTLKVSSSFPRSLIFSTTTPSGLDCNGDSGGPAFYDLKNADGTVKSRFLVGVTSQGDCEASGTYTGSEAFREWVSAQVWGKITPTIVANSGFTNVSGLADGDTFETKATKASAQASVDLDLGETFTLAEVRVAEDNAGTQNVREYDVQCWNGSAWSAALFRDTDTPFATPQLDEHLITNGCTTRRVRVNFYNSGGGIEVFEVELYGRPAGTRTLTVVTDPPSCTTSDVPTGASQMPVGSYPSTCAQDCGGYVFAGWDVSDGLYTTDRSSPCIYVMDIQRSGTIEAKYHPAYVWISAVAGAHGKVTPTGPFQVPYGGTVTLTATPDPGYAVAAYTYPDASNRALTSTSTITFDAFYDGTVSVEFGIPQVWLDVGTDWNGTVSPANEMQVNQGSSITFTLTPNAGYRVKAVCTPTDDECTPWTQNTFTLSNIQPPDRTVTFQFEPIPAADVLIPLALLQSSFATPANLIDGSLATKALDSTTATHEGWVDVKLDRRYKLTRLQVFEDGGAWQVDAYGLQCWNGTAFAPALFRETSAAAVIPAPNEHVIPAATTCTTDRVRINLHNAGSVEAFEVRLYGTPG
jgi:hypothetical protein